MERALRTGIVLGSRQRRNVPAGRIAAAFVIGLTLGLCVAPPARAAKADAEQRAHVVALIYDAAEQWNLDAQLLLRIAWCESRFEPHAYNPASRAAGVFQFIPTTWSWASAGADRAGASPFDPEANIWSAAWVIKNAHLTGGVSHWRACL